MKNKTILSIGIMILVVILIWGIVTNSEILDSNLIKDSKPEQTNPKLEKYRSEEIPEDCRLPEYESDLEWWKQHLSHHKQTWYCLEYYGTSIEELNKN